MYIQVLFTQLFYKSFSELNDDKSLIIVCLNTSSDSKNYGDKLKMLKQIFINWAST